MQKKRLAQVNKLIEQYSTLVRDSASRGRFVVALERAIKQKRRIESWLAVHEKGEDLADMPQIADIAAASWFL
jgi:hypothetical protein